MVTSYRGLMLISRPRRNRKSAAIRALNQETRLHIEDFILPLFVIDGDKIRTPLKSMPGIFNYSIDELLKEVEEALKLGIPAVALFPIISLSLKNEIGQEAINPSGLIPQAVKRLKREFPELCVITDVALDPYTSHGHDGLVGVNGEILNDETVSKLTLMALALAESGADVIAPSDMMDGRVGAIRNTLDKNGFSHVNILAYTAKYASAFYGPYRDTLGSHLAFGDKKSYFMNPANKREALLEAALDIKEGADVIMVKPALLYLDVIAKLKETIHLPLAAYQVSGEYSMIKAAAQNGWIDGTAALLESLMAIKRAGADMILSYAAKEIAPLLR